MKRLVILTALLGLLTAACGGASPTPAPTAVPTAAPPTDVPTAAPTATVEPAQELIRVTDGRGEEVTLEEPAQRVVSLAPSNTEILFAIGAGDRLVGRDDFSDYPEEAQAVESIGSTFGELNAEAIVGLEPDLILAAGITSPEHIATIEDLGLTVFVINNPQDFDGLFGNLQAVSTLTGHEEETQAIVEDFQDRVEVVQEAVEGAEPVSLFYEIDGSDPNAPWTAGSGTFQNYVFELAQGENIAADLESYAQLSLEEIVVRDPQVIMFASGPFVSTTVESLSERPGWGDISAVEEGRVYGVNTDLLDLPGPRLVLGLETVAEILHPDRFDG